jgi:hypothetical protein
MHCGDLLRICDIEGLEAEICSLPVALAAWLCNLIENINGSISAGMRNWKSYNEDPRTREAGD